MQRQKSEQASLSRPSATAAHLEPSHYRHSPQSIVVIQLPLHFSILTDLDGSATSTRAHALVEEYREVMDHLTSNTCSL